MLEANIVYAWGEYSVNTERPYKEGGGIGETFFVIGEKRRKGSIKFRSFSRGLNFKKKWGVTRNIIIDRISKF
jgi:hypothetical protein